MKKANYFVITEIAFIVLPVIILFIISLAKGKPLSLFNTSEMSFAIVLFCGQMIVKLVSALLKSGKKFKWEFIAFVLTMIIVFGLVPGTLYIVLNSIIELNMFFKIVQVVLFFVSIWIYFEVAGYAQEIINDGEN